MAAADAFAGVVLQFLVFGGQFRAYLVAILMDFIQQLVDSCNVNAHRTGGAVLAVGAAGAAAFVLGGQLVEDGVVVLLLVGGMRDFSSNSRSSGSFAFQLTVT